MDMSHAKGPFVRPNVMAARASLFSEEVSKRLLAPLRASALAIAMLLMVGDCALAAPSAHQNRVRLHRPRSFANAQQSLADQLGQMNKNRAQKAGWRRAEKSMKAEQAHLNAQIMQCEPRQRRGDKCPGRASRLASPAGGLGSGVRIALPAPVSKPPRH